jgi:hypothetical protein
MSVLYSDWVLFALVHDAIKIMLSHGEIQISTHTEKVRNTTRGCRLWEEKNSGCKNSSPTEVKRAFIHQNLSILITKSLRNFCQTKSSPQNQRTYI